MASGTTHSAAKDSQAEALSSIAPLIADKQRRARRGLIIFFAFLLLFTALFDSLLLVTQQITILFLCNGLFVMWTPALAAAAARLINHEGFSDLSFRLRARSVIKAMTFALLFPLLIGLISYGSAWLIGLVPFFPFHPTGGLADFISLARDAPRPLQIGMALLYLIPASIIAAAGEELGWRGYMLPRMITGKVPWAIILSGVIWSLWHWPQILVSPPVAGQPQIVTASIFLVTITALGVVSALLQLKSGNIWPSIILHAAWNSIIVESFNAFTPGLDTSLWIGEPGILVAATMVIVVACIYGALRMRGWHYKA